MAVYQRRRLTVVRGQYTQHHDALPKHAYDTREAIIAAVRDQLNSPDSPYVKEAYDRLINDNHSEEEVMKMLGAVLATEMWEISVKERSFDESIYKDRLARLPDMSWLDEN